MHQFLQFRSNRLTGQCIFVGVLQKITPLKGSFKCDVPRCGYHGGGAYGSAQINFTKVYVANVISVTRGGSSQRSRKRC